MSKIEHLPCGEAANESERTAIEKLLSELRNRLGVGRWIVLSNVPIAINSRAIPDELDLIVIGPPGVIVIEVKHWSRSDLRKRREDVEREANKLNDKVRRIASRLRRAGLDPGFLTGHFLLTNETQRWPADRPQERPTEAGCPFFVLSECALLLKTSDSPRFTDTDISTACRAIHPGSHQALTGKRRHFADIINLELLSPAEERFHRVYRGQHARASRVINCI